MKKLTKAVAGLALALTLGVGTASCSYTMFGRDAYVATVNGQKIPTKEYEQALDQTKKQYTARFGVDFNSAQGKEMLDGMKKGILDQLIERQLLLAEASKRGFKVTDAEVDAKLAEIKKQFPDEATFEKAMKEYGLSKSDLEDQVTNGLTIEKLQKDLNKDLQVTDEQVADFYAKNKAQFTHGEEVKASHILVKIDDKTKDADALKKIKDLQAKIKGGADFGKLASENSDDPGSKTQGGSLGYFGKGRMVPEFEKSAFAMKDGQVSEPIKTQFGYHLIKREEARPARTEALTEVSGQIRDQLKEQKGMENFQGMVASLKQDAKIEIKPEYQPKEAPAAAPGAAPGGANPAHGEPGHDHSKH